MKSKLSFFADAYTCCKACKRPFIDWNAQEACLAYSSKHLHQLKSYWHAHIYGDEVTFDMSHRESAWVTRLSSERYHKDCIQHTFNSGHASVPILGAISHNGKSSLVFLKPTGKCGITADNYHHQVLVPIVSAAFHNSSVGFLALPEGQFVKDQAPWHGTRKASVEVKKELGIPVHKRPPASPDLNPIENVWRIMKQHIKARPHFPGTYSVICKAVQEEWDRLKPSDWNPLIDSMLERLMEFRALHGMQTKW